MNEYQRSRAGMQLKTPSSRVGTLPSTSKGGIAVQREKQHRDGEKYEQNNKNNVSLSDGYQYGSPSNG